jgi:AbrB family looped-hinge helix DNA binding protein
MTKQAALEKLVENLGSNKSAKMRVLAKAGIRQREIARFLGTSEQFVSQVLKRERQRQSEVKQSSAEVTGSESANPSIKVKVGPDGRVVIPAKFRESLGLKENDVLFARVEEGEIHLLTPMAAARRARAIIRQFVPEGISLVDELIEDRRKEFEREELDG